MMNLRMMSTTLLITGLFFVSQAQSTELLVELSLAELLNMEVTVASKKSEKISDAAGVISVINMEDIERYGGVTLRDILERVPSLIGSGSGFTDTYGMAVRGDQTKNNAHILILINGRPTREVMDGGISSETFAAFPVNIIESIEVIRGPGSVLYGSQAFSAVINIKTKKTEVNNVSVSALTGINGKGANAYGTLAQGDLNMTLAGRYMDKGGQKFTFHGQDGKLVDLAQSAFLSMDYKGLSVTTAHNAYEATYFLRGQTFVNNWTKTFTNLGYNIEAGESWDMDFNVTHNYATLKTGEYTTFHRKSHDLVTEWTNHLKINDAGRLIIGALYNYDFGVEHAFIPNKVQTNDNGRGSLAFYSQLDYWALKNLKLIGGFQGNLVKDQRLNLSPRVGAIWYPWEKINVKALYSQAFRAPGMNELYLNAGPLKGNPDLKPETTRALDFAVTYNGNSGQISVNYFRNDQQQIINVDRAQTPWRYENLSAITFNGLEVDGKYYVNRALMLTGSWLYQQNENAEGVKRTTPVSSNMLKFGVSYQWSRGITVSVFDMWHGDYGDLFTGSDANPVPNAYNMLNFYASFDLVKLFDMKMNQNLSLFIQANNLLGEKVWLPDGFTDSMPAITESTVLAGINFSLK